jgi:hypothetical protein
MEQSAAGPSGYTPPMKKPKVAIMPGKLLTPVERPPAKEATAEKTPKMESSNKAKASGTPQLVSYARQEREKKLSISLVRGNDKAYSMTMYSGAASVLAAYLGYKDIGDMHRFLFSHHVLSFLSSYKTLHLTKSSVQHPVRCAIESLTITPERVDKLSLADVIAEIDEIRQKLAQNPDVKYGLKHTAGLLMASFLLAWTEYVEGLEYDNDLHKDIVKKETTLAVVRCWKDISKDVNFDDLGLIWKDLQKPKLGPLQEFEEIIAEKYFRVHSMFAYLALTTTKSRLVAKSESPTKVGSYRKVQLIDLPVYMHKPEVIDEPDPATVWKDYYDKNINHPQLPENYNLRPVTLIPRLSKSVSQYLLKKHDENKGSLPPRLETELDPHRFLSAGEKVWRDTLRRVLRLPQLSITFNSLVVISVIDNERIQSIPANGAIPEEWNYLLEMTKESDRLEVEYTVTPVKEADKYWHFESIDLDKLVLSKLFAAGGILGELPPKLSSI